MEYQFVIGIIVCDKDYQYIDSLIKNIEDCVIGNYHIIIYNNCIQNYDNLQERKINNTTILSNTYKCKNSRQVYARKMITEKAYEIKSDYIWFIDADDTVMKVNFNKLEHYTDIIVFPYVGDNYDSSDPGWIPFHDDRALKVELTLTHSDMIERPLWCKFIKTNVLKQAYDMIDAYNLPPISCSEDTLASLLAMKFSKTFSEHKAITYLHSTARSNSQSPDTHLNDIEQCTIGIREFLELLDKLFTKEEYESLRLDLLKYGTICWVIDRICTIKDKNELNIALSGFNKKLGRKYVKEYLKHVKMAKKYDKELKKIEIKYKSVIAPERAIIQEADTEDKKCLS